MWMKKVGRMLSNARAKELLPYVNPDKCCCSCRHYLENPESGEAACVKLNIQTVCIALCSSWDCSKTKAGGQQE